MGTLKEELRSTGLASEKQFCEADATAQLEAELEAAQQAKPAKEKEKRLDILRATSNPDTFRQESKKLLMLCPELAMAKQLLDLAYARCMDRKREQGGMRLIANLNQVKNAFLRGGTDEERRKFVEKNFSKR